MDLEKHGRSATNASYFTNGIAQFLDVLAVQPYDTLARYNLGNALLQIGRFDQALKEFTTVVELEPGHVMANNNLGNLLLRRGRVDEALMRFRKVLDAEPNEPMAHYNLANALLQAGKADEAIDQLRKVIELDPQDVESRCDLANLLYQHGQVDEAVRQFKKAQEIDPAFPQAQNDYVLMVWSLATGAKDFMRNGAKALELALELVAKSDGKNPLHLSVLAAAQAETGRYSDAATTAAQAWQLASQQGNTDLANSLTEQISYYRRNQPFRQTAPADAPPKGTPADK